MEILCPHTEAVVVGVHASFQNYIIKNTLINPCLSRFLYECSKTNRDFNWSNYIPSLADKCRFINNHKYSDKGLINEKVSKESIVIYRKWIYKINSWSNDNNLYNIIKLFRKYHAAT